MTGQTYNFIKTEIEIIIAELFLKKYEFTLTSWLLSLSIRSKTSSVL